MEETKNIPTETFLDLASRALDRVGVVRFCATGASMLPTFREHEPVKVVKVDPEELNTGDIIFYRTPFGVGITHRIMFRTRKDGHLVFYTKGDAVAVPDPPVSADMILGKVVSVQGKHGEVFLDFGWQRLKGKFITVLGLFYLWLVLPLMIIFSLRRLGGKFLGLIQGSNFYRSRARKRFKDLSVEINDAGSDDFRDMSAFGFFRELMVPSSKALAEMAIRWTIPSMKEGEACLVIRGDSKLLGTALLKRWIDKEKETWWIHQFKIRWNYRGIGLGRQLLQKIQEKTGAEGIEKLYMVIRADNRGGLAFCKATGAVESSEDFLPSFSGRMPGRSARFKVLCWKTDAGKENEE